MFLEVLASYLGNPAYWAIFICMLVEGPIVTFVATMFAVDGVVNIWAVLILSALGGLIADTTYYFLGYYFSTFKFVKKLSEKTSSSKLKLELNRLIEKNSFVTILIIKLLPIFAAAGIFYLGKKRYSMKKFFINSILISVGISLIIVGLAYSGTVTLKIFESYLNDYQIYGLMILAMLLGLFLLWYYKPRIQGAIMRFINKGD